MNKLLILTVFLWSSTNVLCFSDLTEANNNNGPVTNMMENFVEHAVTATNKLLTEVITKTETTSNTLLNNMETVVASALLQISQPFEDFQKKISISQCQPLVELEELNQQINSDLFKCTQNVQEILKTFQQDMNDFKLALETSITEIIDLPKKCQNSENSSDFGSLVSCYVGNIADFNQQVANILNNASETIIQTRQFGEEALQEGRSCVNEVIAATMNSFNKTLSTCSKILEQ